MIKNKKMIFFILLLITSFFVITPKKVKASVTAEKIGEAIEMLKDSTEDASMKMTSYVKALNNNDYFSIANYINNDLTEKGIKDVLDENLRIFAKTNGTAYINGVYVIVANGDGQWIENLAFLYMRYFPQNDGMSLYALGDNDNQFVLIYTISVNASGLTYNKRIRNVSTTNPSYKFTFTDEHGSTTYYTSKGGLLDSSIYTNRFSNDYSYNLNKSTYYSKYIAPIGLKTMLMYYPITNTSNPVWLWTYNTYGDYVPTGSSGDSESGDSSGDSGSSDNPSDQMLGLIKNEIEEVKNKIPTSGDIQNAITNSNQEFWGDLSGEQLENEQQQNINKIKEELTNQLNNNEIIGALNIAEGYFIELLQGEPRRF